MRTITPLLFFYISFFPQLLAAQSWNHWKANPAFSLGKPSTGVSLMSQQQACRNEQNLHGNGSAKRSQKPICKVKITIKHSSKSRRSCLKLSMKSERRSQESSHWWLCCALTTHVLEKRDLKSPQRNVVGIPQCPAPDWVHCGLGHKKKKLVAEKLYCVTLLSQRCLGETLYPNPSWPKSLLPYKQLRTGLVLMIFISHLVLGTPHQLSQPSCPYTIAVSTRRSFLLRTCKLSLKM